MTLSKIVFPKDPIRKNRAKLKSTSLAKPELRKMASPSNLTLPKLVSFRKRALKNAACPPKWEARKSASPPKRAPEKLASPRKLVLAKLTFS
jgi:hypothetical protein